MRSPLVQLLGYLAAVIILSATLAPMLWHGGQWLVGLVTSFKQQSTPLIGWIGQKLGSSDFGRYFNRSFLISALVLLYPFLKWMGASRATLGLTPNPRRWSDLAGGFIIAAAPLLLMGGLFMLVGAYRYKPADNLSTIITRTISSTLAVPLLEEFIFRGVFLGLALRAARPWTAILWVSLVFAILHLIKPPNPLPVEITNFPVTWSSGWELMRLIFRGYGDPSFFISEVATLVMVGIILAWSRCRTSSLWLPMGLHGGWVFGVGIFGGFAKTTKSLQSGGWDFTIGDVHIPLIGTNLKLGLAPLIVLMLTFLLLMRWLTRRHDNTPEATA